MVTYRKHSQRRVASAQPSNGESSRKRQLLSAALAPPQPTKLYNGNATRAYSVNNELGVSGKGVAVGIIDTGAACCCYVAVSLPGAATVFCRAAHSALKERPHDIEHDR